MPADAQVNQLPHAYADGQQLADENHIIDIAELKHKSTEPVEGYLETKTCDGTILQVLPLQESNPAADLGQTKWKRHACCRGVRLLKVCSVLMAPKPAQVLFMVQ
jgi:hypothetical protein